MQDENQIRARKQNLLKAIEYENEKISAELKELENRRKILREYEISISEINKILGD